MGAHAQTLLDVCATSAALLGREARRNPHHHMTGSLSLIREDVEKRAPTGVVNTLGEMEVARHPMDVQVLHTDMAVQHGVPIGGLEAEVPPLARHLEMLYSDFSARFATS